MMVYIGVPLFWETTDSERMAKKENVNVVGRWSCCVQLGGFVRNFFVP